MLKNVFIYVVFCFLSFSCVENVDFDQAENIILTPTLESSLLFFEEPATTFVDNSGAEVLTITDSVVIEIFNDEFVKDNLQKAILLFEATNSIKRTFEAKVDFLNELDELQHTITFTVTPSINNEAVITESTEVFEGGNLEAIKTTNKLFLTLTMLASSDGSTLNNNSSGTLGFRSKGTFFFNINTGE
ncbi:hypothetical protein [Pontimicrobium sp. MEBiC01747]